MGRTWGESRPVYPFVRPKRTPDLLASVSDLADAVGQVFEWGRRD